jgi:hypothetical protein
MKIASITGVIVWLDKRPANTSLPIIEPLLLKLILSTLSDGPAMPSSAVYRLISLENSSSAAPGKYTYLSLSRYRLS